VKNIQKKIEFRQFLINWVVEDIIVDKKKIFEIKDFKLGIDEVQLEKLVKLSKIHKNLNNIYVKDGIAFLPPLFIGFLIMFL